MVNYYSNGMHIVTELWADNYTYHTTWIQGLLI